MICNNVSYNIHKNKIENNYEWFTHQTEQSVACHFNLYCLPVAPYA